MGVTSFFALHGVIHIHYLGDKLWLILQATNLNDRACYPIFRQQVCHFLRLRVLVAAIMQGGGNTDNQVAIGKPVFQRSSQRLD